MREFYAYVEEVWKEVVDTMKVITQWRRLHQSFLN